MIDQVSYAVVLNEKMEILIFELQLNNVSKLIVFTTVILSLGVSNRCESRERDQPIGGLSTLI